VGVAELHHESVSDLRSDLETALAYSGADCRGEILGIAAEFKFHGLDAVLDDSLQGTAPSGVEGGDCVIFRVRYEDGQAIGGLDRHNGTGIAGEEAVTPQRRPLGDLGAIDSSYQAGVHLLEGDKAALFFDFRLRLEFGEEFCAISGDGVGVVYRGKAEAELAGSRW